MKYLSTAFLFTIVTLFAWSQNQNFIIKPGAIWPDNNGIHINAHGGGILSFEGKYFWFGEHKIEGRKGNSAQVGVHCYSSKNLVNWNDEGIALKVSENPESSIVKGCVIERPKVIYNKNTEKFIMWFHLELKGQGYKAAKTGVATSDSPTGPFTFIEAVNPNAGQWPINFSEEQKNKIFSDTLTDWSDEWLKAVADGLFIHRDFEKGQMARDMALFIDDDGKAYHIHASEENLTLHISELNDSYTGFTGKYAAVMPAGHNEAPAIFKKNGYYYLITSGCTGWAPNAARSFVAENIFGPWKDLGNPCQGTEEKISTTFQSQSTFIIENPFRKGEYIFMADRWMPKNPIDGRYIWLPIRFNKEGNPVLEWKNEWNLKGN